MIPYRYPLIWAASLAGIAVAVSLTLSAADVLDNPNTGRSCRGSRLTIPACFA